MEHSFEIKGGDLIVTVKNSKEELQKYYHSALVACCNEVTIRGFRKGQAPLDVASRAVNPEMLNERFTRKIIDKSFKSYIQDDAVVAAIRENTLNGTTPLVDLPEPRDGSIVTFSYPIKPVITKIAAYKGIETKVEEKKVDEKAVNDELSRLALNEAELLPTTESAKLGDIATLEVKGSINGIDKPELNERSIDLEIGAHKFVPGFEENVKDHKAGETVSFTVKLPSNYPDGLADKDALFTVKILSVKTKKIPDLNDEFATVQSEYADAKDLADLKAKIADKLAKDYAKNFRNQKYSVAIQNIMDNSEFAIDEKNLKQTIVAAQKQADEEKIEQQGLDFATYLKLTGISEATYENNVWTNNLNQLKAQAIAKYIRDAEKFAAPSEEEVKATAKDFFGIEDLAKLKENIATSYKGQYPQADDKAINEFVEDRLQPIVSQAELNQVIDFVIANNK